MRKLKDGNHHPMVGNTDGVAEIFIKVRGVSVVVRDIGVIFPWVVV